MRRLAVELAPGVLVLAVVIYGAVVAHRTKEALITLRAKMVAAAVDLAVDQSRARHLDTELDELSERYDELTSLQQTAPTAARRAAP